MKNVLAIGGYDPTGGAGVIADAKTIKETGNNPLTIITSLIPQNNQKVYSKEDVSKQILEEQFESIFEDFNIKCVKTGVLSKNAIELILKYHKDYDFKIICDPVIKSTTGRLLTDKETLDLYVDLFNKCYLITPNNEEFKFIKHYMYTKLKKEKYYDENLKELSVLVTGINDTLQKYSGTKIAIFNGRKINKEVHGTGCVFSSAIAGFSTRMPLISAIKNAKKLVLGSVIYAKKTRYGYNTNPLFINEKTIYKNLEYSLFLLKNIKYTLIPDVGSNIGECTILPKNRYDICALSGRLIKDKDTGGYHKAGEFKFGASKILTDVIITANKYDPKIRATMGVRFNEKLMERLKEDGIFCISHFKTDGFENIRKVGIGIDNAFKNYLIEKYIGLQEKNYMLDLSRDIKTDAKISEIGKDSDKFKKDLENNEDNEDNEDNKNGKYIEENSAETNQLNESNNLNDMENENINNLKKLKEDLDGIRDILSSNLINKTPISKNLSKSETLANLREECNKINPEDRENCSDCKYCKNKILYDFIGFKENFDCTLDIVYNKGGHQIEPMIWILGQNSIDVVKKLRILEKTYRKL
ncbi:bifunctional hydroxymethylpyrimidine kinase/phosphomethylpyrimidine kinase [Methanococcus voltae]|uniref:bifunctional hydroxymethylpyrimidine kinase/phosphomethylpyrimidine kinase n=1 Tax=Methanococcus voltae TaxID=2188 RepID=UPI001AEA2589|nr:bifunctional hydroxymethylpyrimidine kinase/phosphomethylpyrimidine kinase [Methanococcus voltae]MBP2172325.1 hydroxymethylpyrimidine/phosphomethylpyrimidine kinase [Methanococcus voltae]